MRQSRSHLNCPWHWNSLAIPAPRAGTQLPGRETAAPAWKRADGGVETGRESPINSKLKPDTWILNRQNAITQIGPWLGLQAVEGVISVVWEFDGLTQPWNVSSRDKIISVLRELLRLCCHSQGWNLPSFKLCCHSTDWRVQCAVGDQDPQKQNQNHSKPTVHSQD